MPSGNSDGLRHGTRWCYSHHRCRCDACAAAQRAYAVSDQGKAARKTGFARALIAMRADPGDARHGTKTGYDYGCRCDRCRAATAEVTRAHQIRSKIKQHGTTTGYGYGCRCAACRAASYEYHRSRRNTENEEPT